MNPDSVHLSCAAKTAQCGPGKHWEDWFRAKTCRRRCIRLAPLICLFYRLLILPTATIMMPFLYTIIEPAFAIICACLPTYRPLFLWMKRQISSTGARSWLSRSSGGNVSSPRHKAPPEKLSPLDSRTTRSTESTATQQWPATTHSSLGTSRSLEPPPVPPKDFTTRRAGIVTQACSEGIYYEHRDFIV